MSGSGSSTLEPKDANVNSNDKYIECTSEVADKVEGATFQQDCPSRKRKVETEEPSTHTSPKQKSSSSSALASSEVVADQGVNTTDQRTLNDNAGQQCLHEHSISNGNIDESFLEGQLKQQLWWAVTTQLKDDKIEDLCNASLYFRQMYLSLMADLLFPKVGKILAEKYHSKHEEEDVYNGAKGKTTTDTGICRSCGRTRKPCWFSDFLKLRLVSRHWCQTVDDYHQDTNVSFTHPFTQKPHPHTLRLCTDILRYGAECEDFLLHFSKTHRPTGRSPFIGKSVIVVFEEIDCLEGKVEEETFTDILDVLKIYGGHIKYLSVRMKKTPIQTYSLYIKFIKVLRSTPNLVELEARFGLGNECRITQRRTLLTTRMIRLPDLPNLQVFCTPYSRSMVALKLIKKYSETLSKIILGTEVFWGEIDQQFAVFALSLPNIRELCVYCTNMSSFNALSKSFNHWPMEKLSIFLPFEESSDKNLFHYTKSVFHKLSRKNLSVSLRHLELHFYVPTNISIEQADSLGFFVPDGEKLCLNLFHLNYFKIEGLPMSLDFLLPARRTLKVLKVKYAGKPFENESESDTSFEEEVAQCWESNSKIRFFQYFPHKVWLSNIWKYFMHLQKLVVIENDESSFYCFQFIRIKKDLICLSIEEPKPATNLYFWD